MENQNKLNTVFAFGLVITLISTIVLGVVTYKLNASNTNQKNEVSKLDSEKKELETKVQVLKEESENIKYNNYIEVVFGFEHVEGIQIDVNDMSTTDKLSNNGEVTLSLVNTKGELIGSIYVLDSKVNGQLNKEDANGAIMTVSSNQCFNIEEKDIKESIIGGRTIKYGYKKESCGQFGDYELKTYHVKMENSKFALLQLFNNVNANDPLVQKILETIK